MRDRDGGKEIEKREILLLEGSQRGKESKSESVTVTNGKMTLPLELLSSTIIIAFRLSMGVVSSIHHHALYPKQIILSARPNTIPKENTVIWGQWEYNQVASIRHRVNPQTLT